MLLLLHEWELIRIIDLSHGEGLMLCLAFVPLSNNRMAESR